MRKSLIDKAFRDATCDRCQARLDRAGLRAVGVREPTSQDRVRNKPVLFLLIDCNACRFRNSLATDANCQDANRAITEFYGIMKQRLHNDTKSHDAGPAGDHGDSTTAALEDPAGCASDQPRPSPSVRPSRRRWQPSHPFTEREIRSFLRMLAKTSLRRNTKSFRQFMKRLGVDIDKPAK